MDKVEKRELEIVGRMLLFGGLSLLLVLGSVVALMTIGLNFGIDFAGGYEVQAKFPKPVSENEVAAALANAGFGGARVQRFGKEENNEYLVLVRETATISDETKEALRQEFEGLAGGADKLLSWSMAASGESVQMAFAQPVEEGQVRATLEKHGLKIKQLTRGEREDRPEFSVEVVSIADEIEQALRSGLSIDREVQIVERVEFVGPQVGEQLRNQGILAVLYSLGFILLYIGVRFDLYFAPGAVIALIHDVLITLGVFSVLQVEFDLPVVAGILALVGYSLNDTIVVYDRIRENRVRLRGRPLRALVNSSINQTLSRTLLTSGTTLLTVIALLIFGGGIVRAFSLSLFVGIIVGTYSSVAIASPIYIWLTERWNIGAPAAVSDGGAQRMTS